MKGSYRLMIFFFGALGGLLFGYDTGVISGAILFIKHDMHLSGSLEGWVVSAVLIGAFIGAGVCGPLAERFGRRWVILGEGVIFCAGAIGSAVSMSTGSLIVFRVLLGVAVGGASVLVPVYLSEMAPTNIRGTLTSLNQLMIVIGILLAYLIDFAYAPSGQWRWMLGLGVVPGIVLTLGIMFMPESPRWLVTHDREGKAREILRKILPPDQVESEVTEIRKLNNLQTGALRDLFQPLMRPLLLVGVLLAVFQQVIGVNAVIYYAPTILTQAGFGTSASILGSVGIGIAQVVMVLVGMILVDKIGRKPLLVIGNILMSGSMMVMAVALKMSSGGTAEGWLDLICMTAFIAAFCLSWGPVMWVVVAEYLPLRYRGAGMGIAAMGNWAADFLVSQTFPGLIQTIGIANLFLIYAIMGVVAILFVVFVVEETKGRSLERIETDFRASVATKRGISRAQKVHQD